MQWRFYIHVYAYAKGNPTNRLPMNSTSTWFGKIHKLFVNFCLSNTSQTKSQQWRYTAFFMSTNKNIKSKWINRKAENIECANSNSISVCWRTLNYTSTWCLMQLVYFINALCHRSSKRKKNPLNSAIFSELFYHHTAELQLYTIA